MTLSKQSALTVLALGIVLSGLVFGGCSQLKNKSPETVSRQDKDSVATIDRKETRGDSSSTEAALEKDSLSREHLLKF